MLKEEESRFIGRKEISEDARKAGVSAHLMLSVRDDEYNYLTLNRNARFLYLPTGGVLMQRNVGDARVQHQGQPQRTQRSNGSWLPRDNAPRQSCQIFEPVCHFPRGWEKGVLAKVLCGYSRAESKVGAAAVFHNQ